MKGDTLCLLMRWKSQEHKGKPLTRYNDNNVIRDVNNRIVVGDGGWNSESTFHPLIDEYTRCRLYSPIGVRTRVMPIASEIYIFHNPIQSQIESNHTLWKIFQTVHNDCRYPRWENHCSSKSVPSKREIC